MLDVAPTELLLVAVVAVVVIGPKDLPKAMRFAGYWVGRARGIARQFRQGFDDMLRESELAEMEKKWADENARIMREFPTGDTPPVAALPAPVDDIDDVPVELTVAPDMIDPAVVPDPIGVSAEQSEMFAAPAPVATPKKPRASRKKAASGTAT